MNICTPEVLPISESSEMTLSIFMHLLLQKILVKIKGIPIDCSRTFVSMIAAVHDGKVCAIINIGSIASEYTRSSTLFTALATTVPTAPVDLPHVARLAG